MQRIIKFRGIYIDSNEFVYGSLIMGLIKDLEFEAIFDATTHIYYKVKAETIGQFIGFPDKNRKEMFEGNVVKYRDDSNTKQIGIVVYSEISCKYYLEAIGGDDEGNQDGELHKDNECEIIGNVTENPELLR